MELRTPWIRNCEAWGGPRRLSHSLEHWQAQRASPALHSLGGASLPEYPPHDSPKDGGPQRSSRRQEESPLLPLLWELSCFFPWTFGAETQMFLFLRLLPYIYRSRRQTPCIITAGAQSCCVWYQTCMFLPTTFWPPLFLSLGSRSKVPQIERL